MAAFGQLKIVPTADIGELGLREGTATAFNWKWYYSWMSSIIWLILIAAFVLPKSNRNINVLFILYPLVILNLIWCIFMGFVQMNTIDATEFGLIFDSTVIGITVLWLISNSLARLRDVFRFLLSLSMLLIIAVINILSYSKEDFNLFATLFVFIALIILVPMVVARKVCGKSCKPVRFIMSLALWTIISSMFAIIGFIIITLIITSSGLVNITFETIFIFTLSGIVFGVFIYVINLSYVILGYINPYYKERFFACLNFDVKFIDANSYISVDSMKN